MDNLENTIQYDLSDLSDIRYDLSDIRYFIDKYNNNPTENMALNYSF